MSIPRTALCTGIILASVTIADAFEIETIDEDLAGRGSLALDSIGRPHVCYHYAYPTPPPRKEVRYAVKDGTTWEIDAHITLSQSGPSDLHDLLYATRAVTAAPETPATAVPGLVLAVSPNPTTTSLTLRFDLMRSTPVQVEIFDASGRTVSELGERLLRSSGPHEIAWNGRNRQGHRVAPGMYFVRLRAGLSSSTAPLIVLE